jgi:hypothetical protein
VCVRSTFLCVCVCVCVPKLLVFETNQRTVEGGTYPHMGIYPGRDPRAAAGFGVGFETVQGRNGDMVAMTHAALMILR